MVTYLLGAGASAHAGYPLASRREEDLYVWARQNTDGGTQAWAGFIESLCEAYGDLCDFERILTDLTECPEGSHVQAWSKMMRGNALGAIRTLIPEMFHVC